MMENNSSSLEKLPWHVVDETCKNEEEKPLCACN
jgi:hypothetical protein